MNAEPAITFRELLAYTDYLAQRWLSYFEEHAAALEVSVGGKTGTLRDLVAHTFQVEQFFADRLLSHPSPPPKKLESPALGELRQIHQDAHQKLAQYISLASEESLKKTQPFASVSPSNRKVLAQAVLHSVHHWAQVAMEVRQAGFPAEKPQDIIISPVME
jgi:uncharacterized damage-inducible protein DinB